MGIHKRVLLALEGDEIKFHRGHVDDKFEIDSGGKPCCTTEDGGLAYGIYGPLSDGELTKAVDFDFGDFTKKRRVHSLRKL